MDFFFLFVAVSLLSLIFVGTMFDRFVFEIAADVAVLPVFIGHMFSFMRDVGAQEWRAIGHVRAINVVALSVASTLP